MEKFCLFKVHDYMDMYPRDHVRTFIADDEESIRKEAIRYAQHMNREYSGGTTKFIKVMSKDEAKKHIDKLIAEEMREVHPDHEFIEQVTVLYNKCYIEQ